MSKLSGKALDKANEVVDGKEYVDCKFNQCTLIYKGGEIPKMTKCQFTNCDWQFQESAARTLVFMANLYHGGAQHVIDGFIQRITGKTAAA